MHGVLDTPSTSSSSWSSFVNTAICHIARLIYFYFIHTLKTKLPTPQKVNGLPVSLDKDKLSISSILASCLNLSMSHPLSSRCNVKHLMLQIISLARTPQHCTQQLLFLVQGRFLHWNQISQHECVSVFDMQCW